MARFLPVKRLDADLGMDSAAIIFTWSSRVGSTSSTKSIFFVEARCFFNRVGGSGQVVASLRMPTRFAKPRMVTASRL